MPSVVRRRAAEIVLAVLAWVPLLASAPGRLPADTKLYLYLDPSRLIADSMWSWDGRQFGGWVPHQNVGYLWPTGPWYWVMERLAVPDWIAHRLWVGLLFALAGWGTLRLVRFLGLGSAAALASALVYQLSPYVLPYVSRTSGLLLPWALLPMLCLAAIRYGRLGRARDLAMLGLLVASTGGLNATALAMVAPGPAIWLLHEARGSGRLLRRAAAAGAVSIAVSAWWLVGLWIQGRHGAPVLAYSETLPSTAATSTSPEVLRGLGYWLFYVRDDLVALTTASTPYQGHPIVMVAGLLLVSLGLFGWLRAPTRWRAPVVLGGVVGVVLAVGAHPFDDPSPLWRLAVDNPRSALSLALRSSTRAVPLVVLALAIGVGVTTRHVARRWRWPEPRVALAVAVLAVVNLPALVGGRLIDPDLDRPQSLPDAWYDTADFLDERLASGHDGAVLLLGGMESAAYRWGYPVDAVLPGLTEKPFLARDWLPLGSAPYMDVLYALDDGFQDGTLEPAAIAPVARLLGADTVMVVNSQQFERFDTVRPERTAAIMGTTDEPPPGLVPLASFGDEQRNEVPGSWSEEISVLPPLSRPEIQLWSVEDASVARTSEGPVAVSADGAGLVSAAAAGVIDGRSLLLEAPTPGTDSPGTSFSGTASPGAGANYSAWVITDGDRRRAHQWRGSQNVWGATEGDVPVIETPDVWDARLRPDDDGQTLAETPGLLVTASAYGDPVTYLPERRPNRAVDGDPTTAWTVAGRTEGQFLRVIAEEPLDELVLRQFASGSRIERVRVETDDTTLSIELDDRSIEGQLVELPEPSREIRIIVERVSGPDPVGFAEILPSNRAVGETIVLGRSGGDPASTTWVFERWRADRLDRARVDPESNIVRTFTGAILGDPGPHDYSVESVARASFRAGDDVLATVFGLGFPAESDSRLHGVPAAWSPAAYDGNPDTAWISAADPDRPSFVIPGPIGEFGLRQVEGYSRVTAVELSDSDSSVIVEIPPDDGDRPAIRDVEGLGDPTIRMRVVGFDPATTIDPRTGAATVLPVAIDEIVGVTAVDPPTDFDTGCRDDLLVLDSVAVPVRISGTVDDALSGQPLDVETCAPLVSLDSGRHDLSTLDGAVSGLDIDRIVISPSTAIVPTTDPPETRPSKPTEAGRGSSAWTIDRCGRGCWFEAPFGWNTGWTATIAGENLGEPVPSAAGRSTWFVPAGTDGRTLDLEWGPQRWMWTGIGIGAVAVLVCLIVCLVAARDTSRRRDAATLPMFGDPGVSLPSSLLTAISVTGAVMLLVDPRWGLIGLILVVAPRRSLARVLSLAGVTLLALSGAYLVVQQFRTGADASFWWPSVFERAHRPTLTGLILLATSALMRPPTASVSES